MDDIAFVIGCARSGTSWLGEILRDSPGFRVTIEDPGIFPRVDAMALDPRRVPALLPGLVAAYRSRLARAGQNLYVDKSHQNIWIAEQLSQVFPSARYIAIQRSPYGTVASMLRHPMVLAHFHRWREFPVPNRHIGLTEDLVPRYSALSLTTKCALRWRSHNKRLNDLEEGLGDRLLRMYYESMVTDPAGEASRLGAFLGRPVRDFVADRAPLEKWRRVLSGRQQATIDDVIADRVPW